MGCSSTRQSDGVPARTSVRRRAPWPRTQPAFSAFAIAFGLASCVKARLPMRIAAATVLCLALAIVCGKAQPVAGPFRELRFRAIGPAVMGGRLHDVTALSNDPSTVIVASATGGLWKSTNHGTTWTPIFEGQSTATFGVMAMAPSNPDIMRAGSGKHNTRQSSSWGDGVYRSTDGGKSWSHVGLEDSRAIGRIVVDPADPGVAYVAASGNLWAPSDMRGVFKTTDGGNSWTHSLTSTATRAPSILSWIRTTHERCTPRRTRGYASLAASTAAGRPAACTKAPMPARRGRNSRTACRPATSAVSAWRSRRRHGVLFTPSSRTPPPPASVALDRWRRQLDAHEQAERSALVLQRHLCRPHE